MSYEGKYNDQLLFLYLKFAKKYVGNKKMIHTTGRSKSADKVLGVVVDRKLCNLCLSSLELQQGVAA